MIPLLAAAVADSLPITVFSSQKILDFVWIDVVLDAFIKSAFGSCIRGAANIGSGNSTRVVDLSGSVSRIEVVAEREQDVGRFVAGITRGKRLLKISEADDPLWVLPRTT